MKGFCSLIKKDIRLLISGKFFLMSLGFLIIYTLYVNLGYVRLMDAGMYQVYLYDPQEHRRQFLRWYIQFPQRKNLMPYC